MHQITLRRVDDLHCHFRNGALLKEVVPLTARYAGRAAARPNTRPRAILTSYDVQWYRGEILRALENIPARYPFEPLTAIVIRDAITPQMVAEMQRA